MPKSVLLSCVILLAVSVAAPAAAAQRYKKTVESYSVPDVTLVDQHGRKVKFTALLNSGKVVMVDFIFTTCTTICPVLSANFANFQGRGSFDPKEVHLVSLSIDPEYDTPRKMKEYLKRYDAKPGWDFLTGSKADIERLVKALNAYTPNKMTHLPLILLHSRTGNRWIRIYGMIGTSELEREFEAAKRL